MADAVTTISKVFGYSGKTVELPLISGFIEKDPLGRALRLTSSFIKGLSVKEDRIDTSKATAINDILNSGTVTADRIIRATQAVSGSNAGSVLNVVGSLSKNAIAKLDPQTINNLNTVFNTIESLEDSLTGGVGNIVANAAGQLQVTLPGISATPATGLDALLGITPSTTVSLEEYEKVFAEATQDVENMLGSISAINTALAALGVAGGVLSIAGLGVQALSAAGDALTAPQYARAWSIMNPYIQQQAAAFGPNKNAKYLKWDYDTMIAVGQLFASRYSDIAILENPPNYLSQWLNQILEFGTDKLIGMMRVVPVWKTQMDTVGAVMNDPLFKALNPTQAEDFKTAYESMYKAINEYIGLINDQMKAFPQTNWKYYLVDTTGPQVANWISNIKTLQEIIDQLTGMIITLSKMAAAAYSGAIDGYTMSTTVASLTPEKTGIRLKHPVTDLERVMTGPDWSLTTKELISAIRDLTLVETKTITRTKTDTKTRKTRRKMKKRRKLKITSRNNNKSTPIIIGEIDTSPNVKSIRMVRFIFDIPSDIESNSKGTIVVFLEGGRVLYYKNKPRGLFSYITAYPATLSEFKKDLQRRITPASARRSITEELKQKSKYNYY